MNQLIPVVNKLQEVFHQVGMIDTIDLPQIAVVGSQSSGKSSVLENIVGRDFLPRGTGIVTRRPLVLQLINTSNSKDKTEYGVFFHKKTEKYTDFNDIRNEIIEETEREAGGKCISPKPIHLKIYSPNVLNLTLIDLPGITKVPVGNQPKDIEEQIKNMVLHFIKQSNCIILAVTPANGDIANSESLKIARRVDPQGKRTIGVLTKLDIMDEGTDAMDILSGKVIQLKHDFIGVVNRGQRDIESNKPIKDALDKEKQFFDSHPAYRSVAHKMGIPYLAKKLNSILLNHIRKTLPEIRAKISSLIQKGQQRLAEYGTPLAESNMDNGALLLQLLTQFSREYCDTIDGKHTKLTDKGALFGGALINHIFTDKFTPLINGMDACDQLSDMEIKTAIRNANGTRNSLFVPEESFELLVRRQVNRLLDPCLRCCEQVYKELINILEVSDKNLTRFPNLKERVHEFCIGLLQRYLKPLKRFIRDVISIELAYINTNHPDFFNGGQTSGVMLQSITDQNQGPTDQPNHHGPNQGRKQPPTPHQRGNYQNSDQTKESSDDETSDEDINDDDWYAVDADEIRREMHQEAKQVAKEEKSKSFYSNLLSPFGFHHNKKHSSSSSQSQSKSQSQSQSKSKSKPSTTTVPTTKNKSSRKRKSRPLPPIPHREKSTTSTSTSHTNSSFNILHRQSYEYDYNYTSGSNPSSLSKEDRDSRIIKELLTSYFNIVRKNIADKVPKAIMHFLVNMSKDHLQSELVGAVYKPDLFEDLLFENEEVAQKRKAAQKMLDVLLRAQETLNTIRDVRF